LLLELLMVVAADVAVAVAVAVAADVAAVVLLLLLQQWPGIGAAVVVSVSRLLPLAFAYFASEWHSFLRQFFATFSPPQKSPFLHHFPCGAHTN